MIIKTMEVEEEVYANKFACAHARIDDFESMSLLLVSEM